MMKPRRAGLLFAGLLGTLVILRGLSGAQQPTGGSISAFRAVYENVTGTLGLFRLDTTNNFYVFGSSKQIPGAVLVSSGTAVIQSTSTVATNPILQIRNAAGTILGSWMQNGNLQLVTGQYFGDGSTLTGIPGTGSTTTWTGGNKFVGVAGTSVTAGNFFVSAVTTMTGTEYHTGAVHMSTGSCVDFAANFGFTTTATSFVAAAQVAQSSVTITLAGTRVRCELQGSSSNGTSGAQTFASFAMDGSVSAFPNTSSSIGLVWVDEPSAGYPMNIGTARELTTTPGAHTFLFGLWGNAGTITFPAVGASNTAQFCCREVPAQ
ncbi:MAG TPA: hypothetical protein VN915_06790 [Elusimicrobiota bacterium]|nr:hypothetical protein [Elusimicrobiota bacterium]